jgi:hypothetical protein
MELSKRQNEAGVGMRHNHLFEEPFARRIMPSGIHITCSYRLRGEFYIRAESSRAGGPKRCLEDKKKPGTR